MFHDNPKDSTAGWITITNIVKYFDFNDQIEIGPPVTSSGEFESGWSLVADDALQLKKGEAKSKTR